MPTKWSLKLHVVVFETSVLNFDSMIYKSELIGIRYRRHTHKIVLCRDLHS